MIHVLTVHHQSEQWIDIQLDYLRRHLSEPYLTWANLEGVEHRADSFDHVVPAIGAHPGKLNLLAAEASAKASPEDLLMFLDGDAFPVADPMPTVRQALAQSDLVAVQRRENLNDVQPHPCFAVCTVATWRSLQGDWSGGYAWTSERWGQMTDTGGNLLRLLELSGLSWTPVLRSNRTDLHPLWFGIYGDVVYHHGAGFRAPISRHDAAQQPVPLLGHAEQWRLVGRLVRRINDSRRERWFRAKERQAHEMSESIYRDIIEDPSFYERFLKSAEGADR